MSSSGIDFGEQSAWDADPEVNEPLELDIYKEGGRWRLRLSHPDSDSDRVVGTTADSLDGFIDVVEWR